MGLYVEEFRHRQAQILQAPVITWPECHGYDERFCEYGHYVWEGWVFEHSDSHDWTEPRTLKGDLSLPAYYRVEGQLWKQYWMSAGVVSPRVGGDSSSLEFVVSPNGDKHEISTLDDDEYGHVYSFLLDMQLTQPATTCSMTGHGRLSGQHGRAGETLCDTGGLSELSGGSPVAVRVRLSPLRGKQRMGDGCEPPVEASSPKS